MPFSSFKAWVLRHVRPTPSPPVKPPPEPVLILQLGVQAGGDEPPEETIEWDSFDEGTD